MSDVLVPGGRDVRGTLEEPADATGAVVVACPPHPRHGGHRGDRRLVATSEALRERGVACLRIDYGEWDEGRGEREDVGNAIRWARDRYDRVGVFGFSFGASLALLASATVDRDGDASGGGRGVAAVSALAPTATLGDGLDAVAAVDALACPVQICYGERDTTVDWKPVVERAADLGGDVVAFSADHFFVGQHATVARTAAEFLASRLV